MEEALIVIDCQVRQDKQIRLDTPRHADVGI